MGASTDGYSFGAVNQSTKKQVVTLYGTFWTWDGGQDMYSSFIYGPTGGSNVEFPYNIYLGYVGFLSQDGMSTSIITDGGTYGGTELMGPPIACDTTHHFQSHAYMPGSTPQNTFGGTLYFKTWAIDATFGTPSSSSVTYNSATISCDYYPNTVESNATATLQYKKSTDVTWTDADSQTGQSGYTVHSFSKAITGLSALTTYQYRLKVHQITTNDQTLYSTTQTFDTLAANPTITTNAATVVTNSGATLNGTVNPNGISTTYYFEYGPTTSYGTTTASQGPGSGTSNVAFEQAITGLTASTTYHYRAVAVAGGSTYNGSDASFATPGDPAVEAAQEDHMHIYEYDGKYGVQSTFYFTLSSPAGTSSDRLVTTAPASLFASGDVKISIDGGSFANATNAVVQVAASNPLYSLTLTAAEMAGTQIVVQMVDQNGPAFRDAFLMVRTKIQVGQVDVDATQIGGNTPGFTTTGVGTGAGLIAIGGATAAGDIIGFNNSDKLRKGVAQAGGASTVTLDASASAVNDYYVGSIITIVSGTGAGQSRVCASYVGSTKVATVTRGWGTNPAAASVFIVTPGPEVWYETHAELASIPAVGGTYGDKFQFLHQRFALKITETATTQTLFKADNATTLGTRSVSDNGVTQTVGALA